jgi:hypothetical protein
MAQVPTATCSDRAGKPIPSVPDNSVTGGNIIAEATRENGARVIKWRPAGFAGMPEVERVFVYLHECAHHTLGHVDTPVNSIEDRAREEREADCWAAQTMVEGGMVSLNGLDTLRERRKGVVGDAVHLGGDALLLSLEECLNAKTDRKRWQPVLDSLAEASHTRFASIAGPLIRDVLPDSVRMSTLDPPSTFDCEIRRTGSFVCVIFTSRKPGPAEDRYSEIRRILERWKPEGWTAEERLDPSSEQPRQFVLKEGATGSVMALILHRLNRIYFIVRPPPG